MHVPLDGIRRSLCPNGFVERASPIRLGGGQLRHFPVGAIELSDAVEEGHVFSLLVLLYRFLEGSCDQPRRSLTTPQTVDPWAMDAIVWGGASIRRDHSLHWVLEGLWALLSWSDCRSPIRHFDFSCMCQPAFDSYAHQSFEDCTIRSSGFFFPGSRGAHKRRIGGSGPSALDPYHCNSSISELHLDECPWGSLCYIHFFLSLLAGLWVPFFSSLALLSLGALCRLPLTALPGLPHSVRRLLSTSPSPGWACVIRGWDVGNVGCDRATVLLWDPIPTPKKGRRHGRECHCRLPLCTRLLMVFLGFAHLPQCVWATPEEHANAVRTIQAFLHHFPDQLRDGVNLSRGSRTVAERTAPVGPMKGLPKHCIILQADFPVQHVLVYQDMPCSVPAFIQGAVDLQAPCMTDHTLHPTEPQIVPGLASLVAVPDWMHNTDKTVYVLDFSFWDGPVFAVIDWRYINLTSFAALARKYSPVPWQVTHGRGDLVLLPGMSIFAIPGDVFRFSPLGHPTSPRPTLEQFLAEEDQWDANPAIPREIARHNWLLLRSHVTRTPIYAGESHDELLRVAAESCHSEVGELDFCSPFEDGPLRDLVFQGQLIRGVLAAEPRASGSRRMGAFVFVDSRLLGLPPSFRYCPAGWVDLTYFTAFLALRPPEGYKLTALGVPFEGDRVLVSDRCTLQLRYVHVEPEASLAAPTQAARGFADFGLTPDVPPPVALRRDIPTPFVREDRPPPDPEEALAVVVPDEQETQVPQCCFLILAVDFRPEVVSVDLQLPCDVEEALQRVAESRTADHAVYLDNLQPASPQPDEAFGVLLALPDWPIASAIVVIDARAVDGRLFAHAVRGRFNRQSLLAQLGIEDCLGLRVYLQGAALDDATWYAFQTGETILFKLRDEPPPPPAHLDDMLMDGHDWGDHCPSYEGPHFPAFRVLSDGGQHMILVDVDRVRNFADFQQVVRDQLRLRSEQPVICSSVPRVTDLAVLGQSCKAILVASERVLRLPMPPGRLSLYTPIVFVDCRCIIRGFSWLAAASGLVDLERLVASFRDDVPVGYCPEVKGAATELHLDRPYLRVSYGTLLSVTFVLEAKDSEETSSAPSSNDSSQEAPREDDPQDAAPSREPPTERRERSRSPHMQPPPPSADSLKRSWTGDTCSLLSWEGRHPGKRPPGPTVALSTFLQWFPCPHNDTLASCVTLSPVTMDIGPRSDLFMLPLAPLWDLAGQPRACKVLTDPRAVTAGPVHLIAALHRVTTRLGGTWRYMPYDADPLTDDSEDSISEESSPDEEPTIMHFLLLTPGYKASRVTVSALLPILQDEVIELIQRQRRLEDRQLLPVLLPVNPQPCPGIGVVLAMPAWWSLALDAPCCLCLDTSAIDGRVFAAPSPRYVSRRHLLHLAGLPVDDNVAVHEQGSFTPLALDSQCHATTGAAFVFLPRGSIIPTLHALAQDLLSRQAWSPTVTVPHIPDGLHYCLVHEDETILFEMQTGEPMTYRAQIAACVGTNQQTLRLFPANPQVRDSTLFGSPCRAVVAVCVPSSVMPASFHGVLVDARSLFAGWRAYQAVAGRFSCLSAIVALQHLLPTGWRVLFVGVPPHTDLVDTHPGQVFTAVAESIEIGETPSAAAEGGPNSPSHTAYTPAATHRETPTGPGGDGEEHTRSASDVEDEPIVGSDIDSRQGAEVGTGFITCTFVVLGQFYSPELVEVRLPAGIGVAEAMSLVQAARSPHDALVMPNILPVDPQPSRTHAIALSAPAWPYRGAVVALDCRPLGRTAFAVHLVGRVSRDDLLRVAQLESDFRGAVFVGTLPWPLPQDAHITLSNGDLVIFRPPEDRGHSVYQLSDMLRSSDAWDPAFDPTSEFCLSPANCIWV